MMAWNKWVDRFVRPLFDLVRPVPGLAWIPMFILLFGIGIMPKAAVIFLSTAVACIVNCYTGIRQTRQEHLWVGDVFGASDAQKLFKIAIPTALPMIFTGLRVAMGAAWMALVAAELLGAGGLYTFFRIIVPNMLSGILVSALLSLGSIFTDYAVIKIIAGSRYITAQAQLYEINKTIGGPIASAVVIVMFTTTLLIAVASYKLQNKSEGQSQK